VQKGSLLDILDEKGGLYRAIPYGFTSLSGFVPFWPLKATARLFLFLARMAGIPWFKAGFSLFPDGFVPVFFQSWEGYLPPSVTNPWALSRGNGRF